MIEEEKRAKLDVYKQLEAIINSETCLSDEPTSCKYDGDCNYHIIDYIKEWLKNEKEKVQ